MTQPLPPSPHSPCPRSFARLALDRLGAAWAHLVWIAQILWACRISVVSGVGGLLLFGAVVQAQNLFADISFGDTFRGALHWLAVFAATFFVWAFPIHYGARRILEENGWLVSRRLRQRLPKADLAPLYEGLRADLAHPIVWTPRILGLLPFVAIGLGLLGAYRSVDGAQILDESLKTHRQILGLGLLDAAAAALFFVFVIMRKPLLARIETRMDQALADWLLEAFILISLCGTTFVFVFAYFYPDILADLAPRALLLPFLFGSLVLGLSYLVRIGYRFGLPIVAFICAGAIMVTAMNTHLHDLRTIPATLDKSASRQIDIKEAVARWRSANGCADSECPAALLIAAEGGASRAAFMTATVIGHLLDRANELNDPAGLHSPARRIFALSGVSGGAFAAATIRAAIADAIARQSDAPPCVATHRTWFGSGRDDDAYRSSWRACLQLLVSGDYLSPVFVGFGFRDYLAPPKWLFGRQSWIEDRAALLEKAWERHYDYVTSGQGRLETGAACGAETDKGLCRKFGYAGATPEGAWAPLLLLNGASAKTGRRIIASDLISTRADINSEGAPSRAPLYSAAYDLFEILSRGCGEIIGKICAAAALGDADQPGARNAPDIRLSTAALTSARFPIISPVGIAYSFEEEAYGDRIVDGGYFENAGLTTTWDIATALEKEGVASLILWIQNQPKSDVDDALTPPRAAGTPKIGKLNQGLLGQLTDSLGAPIDAILAAREGHGAEAADLVDRSILSLNEKVKAPPGAPSARFFQIGVRAKPNFAQGDVKDPVLDAACAGVAGQSLSMAEVSMSWWLSAAVQADLDVQLCDQGNRRSLRDLMQGLSR